MNWKRAKYVLPRLKIFAIPGHTAVEVIILKYPNLRALLVEEPEAGQYYDKLPDYVKQQISTRAQSVNSFESLRDYAENLLRGDD